MKDKNKDRDPEEIIELLKNFYSPEAEEMQDGSQFFQELNTKIEDRKSYNRIAKINDEIEDTYIRRQERFQNFITKLEESFTSMEQAKNKKQGKRNLLMILLFALIIIVSGYIGFNLGSSTKSLEKPTRSLKLDL